MYQGAAGYFWSMGAGSTTRARALAFYGSYVRPEYDDYKSYGFFVRCEIYYLSSHSRLRMEGMLILHLVIL